MMELFRHPFFFIWLAAGFAALVFFYFKAAAVTESYALKLMSQEQLKKMAGEGPLKRKKIRDRLYLAALALLFIAAAGPQWGVELSPVTDLNGNIFIAMDTSSSMAAKDIKPTRLDNAKIMLSSLIDKFKDYRLGIIAFSGEAFVQCPLTTDADAVKYFLSYLAPGMLPTPGTNIAAAIETALDALQKYSGDKMLVLITDGESLSGELDSALKDAAAANMKIFAIGIGKTEGELIPVTDAAGNFTDYKKDTAGKTVVTRLDENTLAKIARETGGGYIRYGGDPESAAAEIRAAADRMAMAKTKGFGKAAYKNRYQIPLFLAFLLLLIELIFMEKGFMLPSNLRAFAARLKRPAAVILCVFLGISAADAASPVSIARKGNSAYDQGEFPKARDYYDEAVQKDIKDPRLTYNRGAAFYKMQDYTKAAEDFESSASSKKLREKASYNAGNAYYKMSDFKKAISKYRTAVLADPKDLQAKYNLQKAIEQLKIQQQQNKSCNDPKKDQQQDQKKDQQQKQNDKGGGQDQQQQKDQERQKRNEAAKQQAEKLLEMMKEKEKSSNAAKDMIKARAAANKPKKRQNETGKDW